MKGFLKRSILQPLLSTKKGSIIAFGLGIIIVYVVVQNAGLYFANIEGEPIKRDLGLVRLSHYEITKQCENIQIPRKKDILWRNGYYQYFYNTRFETTNYFTAIYYDNRDINFKFGEGKPVIRINILVGLNANLSWSQNLGLEKCQKMDIYLLYWSNSSNIHGVSVKCTCMVIFSAVRWEVNQIKYYVSHWECPTLKNIQYTSNPTVYASLMEKQCMNKPTTYIPITIPRQPNRSEGMDLKQNVALIMKSWFGNWTRDFAPYFVSWIEIIKKFGISHIFASKDALVVDDVMAKVLKHYEDSGILTLKNVPTNMDEVKVPFTNFSIDQMGMFLSINDVFYQNMHMYWYFIQFDIDEILVPKYKSSYSSAIKHILDKYPAAKNSASIACPMSLFYMNNQPGNTSFPAHLPLFRQTYRQPYETKFNSFGKIILDSPKSYHNPRTCLLVGTHYCYYTYEDHITKVEMDISSEDTLVHHYRNSCKKEPSVCKTEHTRQINDNFLNSADGKQLSATIENILSKCNYFKMN